MPFNLPRWSVTHVRLVPYRDRCSARCLLSSMRVTDVQSDIYSPACALPMFSQISTLQHARYRCSVRYLLSSVRVTDVQPDIYSPACALPMFSQISTLQRARYRCSARYLLSSVRARMTSVDDLRLNVFHIYILTPFNFH